MGNGSPSPSASTPNLLLTAEYRALHVGPWPRFFARQFVDLWVLAAILFPILDYFYSNLPNFLYDFCYDLTVCFVWFLLEPWFLASFGTTLGKFLFSINVRNLLGNKLSLKEAYRRSFGVWLYGFALGLPAFRVLFVLLSYIKLITSGTTRWDKNACVVTHGKIKLSKMIILLLLQISLFAWVYFWANLAAIYDTFLIAKPMWQLRNEVKTLPAMVDPETELTTIYLVPKGAAANKTNHDLLVLRYRAIHKTVDEINKSDYYNYATTIILNKVCTPDSSIYLLLNQSGYMEKSPPSFQAVFSFKDKDYKKIMNLTFDLKDCRNYPLSVPQSPLTELPLNQPLPLDEVRNWVVNAVRDIFTNDFTNFEKTFLNAKKYFTNQGWNVYVKQVEAAHIQSDVEKNKWTIKVKIVDAPKLIKEGVINHMQIEEGIIHNQYAWEFEMPIALTISGPPDDNQGSFTNTWDLKMVIVRQPFQTSFHGLGIIKIIATRLGGSA